MAIACWSNVKVSAPQRLVTATGANRTLRRIHISSPVQGVVELLMPQLTVNGGYAVATDGAANWLIGGYDKIMLSIDNGLTWTTKRNVAGDTCQALCMKSGVWLAVVFGGGVSKILRSTDSGVTWNTQYTSSAGQTISSLTYLGTTWAATNQTANQILYSTDNGVTWNTSASTVTGANCVSAPDSGTNWLAAGSDGIYRSTNAAVTWTKIQSLVTTKIISTSVSGCVAIGPGGIYQSDDSLNWQLVQLLDAQPVALATNGFNQYVVVTASGSVWRAIDNGNGKTWSRIFTLPIPAQAALQSTVLCIVDSSGYLYRVDPTYSYWYALMDGFAFYIEAYESDNPSPDYQLSANYGIDIITSNLVAVTILGE